RIVRSPFRRENTATTNATVDCTLLSEKGPCKGSFQRYYWDSQELTCKGFIYGGCGGNSNNFKTIDECMSACP
ncbi:unnamed protein product, partial [Allacma fusca]